MKYKVKVIETLDNPLRRCLAWSGSEGRREHPLSNQPHPGEGDPQRSDTAAGN